MTTNDRLRRRQLVEGMLLVIIGVLMLVQTWHFQNEAASQRRCLAENFQKLSISLNMRSKLVERETNLNRDLWGIYADAAGLVKEDPTQELKPADQERLQRRLVAQLLEYQKVIAEIQAERQNNPLPPYPIGQCAQ